MNFTLIVDPVHAEDDLLVLIVNKGDNVILAMPKPDGIPVLPESQRNFFIDLSSTGVYLKNVYFICRGKVARGKSVDT